MYTLQVFHAGSPTASETVVELTASDVMARIPLLLAQHSDCETVVVSLGETRLFAVDCAGNRLP